MFEYSLWLLSQQIDQDLPEVPHPDLEERSPYPQNHLLMEEMESSHLISRNWAGISCFSYEIYSNSH